MDEKLKLEVRNRMSAAKLVENQKATIDFIPNSKKNGKLFFACGSIEAGYITPSLLAHVKDENLSINDLSYAEIRKPGSENWVPCLMYKKATRKLGAELLG